MKLLKLKKQIIACACAFGLLLGVGGVVALQRSSDTPIAVTADAATEITIANDPGAILDESSSSQFRLLLTAPINNQPDAWQYNVPLTALNGLQDKLLIAGKTPTEWAALDVGFSLTTRSSTQPVFKFDKTKLAEKGYSVLGSQFVVRLPEDCVLEGGYGTVKAFVIYSKGQTGSWQTNYLSLLTLGSRTEGPIRYEGATNGLFQVKVWFSEAVIAANGASDVDISIDKMEGLENALYFNGKSLAEWNGFSCCPARKSYGTSYTK